MDNQTVKKNVKFLLRHLRVLPPPYAASESNRMVLLYFILDSLDILNHLDAVTPAQKGRIIEWIYSLQIADDDGEHNGFRGSGFFGKCDKTAAKKWDLANIAMTYTAILLLQILGDDISRLHKSRVLESLRRAQNSDGSFGPLFCRDCESDLRFSYCAAAICHMLGDWSGFDVALGTKYVLSCRSYDGVFGMKPGCEGHAGSTYVGLSFLHLTENIHLLCENPLNKANADPFTRFPSMIKWLCDRQVGGLNGRPNKPADCCYSFWVCGSLALLGVPAVKDTPYCIDQNLLVEFINRCNCDLGGFSKTPDVYQDLLHTHFALCGLSLLKQDGIISISPRIAHVPINE